MALLGQMISTRSEPAIPAPGRTEMIDGAGASAQVLGVLLVPTLKEKSPAESGPWLSAMSTMMPLMPF